MESPLILYKIQVEHGSVFRQLFNEYLFKILSIALCDSRACSLQKKSRQKSEPKSELFLRNICSHKLSRITQ